MQVIRAPLLFLSALPCLAATFGTVVPHAQPLADLVIDEARRRLYVVNTASNQVEVYATNVTMAFGAKGRLQASADGRLIIGVHMQAASRAVWVYDAASSIVLSSRLIGGISSMLAVSPDARTFLSGPLLFETSTLLVQAQ